MNIQKLVFSTEYIKTATIIDKKEQNFERRKSQV